MRIAGTGVSMTELRVMGEALGDVVPDRMVVRVNVGARNFADKQVAKDRFTIAVEAVRQVLAPVADTLRQGRVWVSSHTPYQASSETHQVRSEVSAEFGWPEPGLTVVAKTVTALAEIDNVDVTTCWRVSPGKRKQAVDALTQQAVADARSRAEKLAAALGLSITEAVTVGDPQLFGDLTSDSDHHVLRAGGRALSLGVGDGEDAGVMLTDTPPPEAISATVAAVYLAQ